jgi:hypothetical protein
MESYAAMGIPFFVKLGIVFSPGTWYPLDITREKRNCEIALYYDKTRGQEHY